MKHNAFISYRQQTEHKLALALETSLTKFAKPTFKRQALHIFRDASDLSANANLWGTIQKNLELSDYLILLASPDSAASKWCKRELEWWLEHKSPDTILLILTGGEWKWDDLRNDFDFETTDAVNEVLSGVFKNEPLYTDFRNIDPGAYNLKSPEFRERLVMIAATLHGKTVADMIGEESIQHRKNLRIRNGAIAILSVLLLFSVLASIFAYNKSVEAQRQTQRFQLSSMIANAKVLEGKDPTEGLSLAKQAWQWADSLNFPTREATENLIQIYYRNHFYIQPIDSVPIYRNELRDNIGGSFLRVEEGKLTEYNSDGIAVREFLPPDYSFPVEKGLFSPKGNFVVRFGENNHGIHVFKRTGECVYDKFQPWGFIGGVRSRIAFDERETRFIATGDWLGHLPECYDLYEMDCQKSDRKLLGHDNDISAVSISPDGSSLSSGDWSGKIIIHGSRGRERVLLGHQGEVIDSLHFSPDGEILVSKSKSFTRYWPVHANSYRKLDFRNFDLDEDTARFSQNEYFLPNEGRMADLDGPYPPGDTQEIEVSIYRQEEGQDRGLQNQFGDFLIDLGGELMNSKMGYHAILTGDNYHFIAVAMDLKWYPLGPKKIIGEIASYSEFGRVPDLSKKEVKNLIE